MKIKNKLVKICVGQLAACAILAAPQSQAQGHWFAGAFSTNRGAQLMEYTNGGSYVASSGYIYWLTYTNAGIYSNLYNGGNPTFTALGNGTTSEDEGSGSPYTAANGSFLWNKVVSLTGPAGGHFYFFDVDNIYSPTRTSTNSPTFVVGVSDTSTNYLFALSDPVNGAGAPGGDPYGHIHGRRIAVDLPGTYTLGLQIIDLSTNGAGGGPIHSPSQVYYATLQAGNTINSIALNSNGANVTFPTLTSVVNLAGKNTNAIYSLQSTTNLADPAGWTLVATNVGSSYFQTLTDSNYDAGSKFYRLKITAKGDVN
jgi:hypothetical protein